MNNTKVYIAYFTDDMCDSIRKNIRSFELEWKSYVSYHRDFQTIERSNAISLMNEFKIVFAEITSTIQLRREDFNLFLSVVGK